jgi:hypothetical protein
VSEPNNPANTETAMKSIFGFLGALLVEKLFKSFSHLIDTFYDPKYEWALKWQIFLFLVLVSAWTFRHIYGTALSLLKSSEIIELPLSGKWDNFHVLLWRFGEFLSFIIIFHISGIVEKLADEYKKPEGLSSILPYVLRVFWCDLCLLCLVWTIWRVIYNHVICKIVSKSSGGKSTDQRRWASVFAIAILMIIPIIIDFFSYMSCADNPSIILLALLVVGIIYTYLEFWDTAQPKTQTTQN